MPMASFNPIMVCQDCGMVQYLKYKDQLKRHRGLKTRLRKKENLGKEDKDEKSNKESREEDCKEVESENEES